MESAPFKIGFPARVQKVEEKIHKNYISGYGETAIFREVSEGWFVTLAGSNMSVYVGKEKPPIAPGYYVIIHMEFKGVAEMAGG